MADNMKHSTRRDYSVLRPAATLFRPAVPSIPLPFDTSNWLRQMEKHLTVYDSDDNDLDYEWSLRRGLTYYPPYGPRPRLPKSQPLDISHKPACIETHHWRRLSPEYRAKRRDSNFYRPRDLYRLWTRLSEAELEELKKAKFVADLMQYYRRTLPNLRTVRWSYVILKCDRDEWRCRRRSDQVPKGFDRRPQGFEVVWAIFMSGKDPFVNQNPHYPNVWLRALALLFIHLDSGPHTTGDQNIDHYIRGFILTMRGIPENSSNVLWLRDWYFGGGDLALDAWRRGPDVKVAHRYQREARNGMQKLMDQLRREHGSLWPIAEFRAVAFVSHFFNLEQMLDPIRLECGYDQPAVGHCGRRKPWTHPVRDENHLRPPPAILNPSPLRPDLETLPMWTVNVDHVINQLFAFTMSAQHEISISGMHDMGFSDFPVEGIEAVLAKMFPEIPTSIWGVNTTFDVVDMEE